MQITVTGQQIDVGEALRLHIEDAIESTTEYVISPQSEDDDGVETAADNPIIIAENQTVIENLTVSEAVMRIDLADAPAFVFRNSKHGGLGVVYRRDDGNIGWIDTPESED